MSFIFILLVKVFCTAIGGELSQTEESAEPGGRLFFNQIPPPQQKNECADPTQPPLTASILPMVLLAIILCLNHKHIITARIRRMWKVMFYRCLSVKKGREYPLVLSLVLSQVLSGGRGYPLVSQACSFGDWSPEQDRGYSNWDSRRCPMSFPGHEPPPPPTRTG